MKTNVLGKRHLPSLLLLIIVIVFISSCSKPYYQVNNFKKRTAKHQSIAVVPVKMIFTGKLPEDVDKKEVAKIEEAESIEFQRTLFNEILKNNRYGEHGFRIKFLPVSETNQLLEKADISVRESWQKTPEELAEALGVEAVVQARIQKTRYMSDLVSYGLDLGRKLLTILTGRLEVVALPNNLSKTNDIQADCEVVDGKDGLVLWAMTLQQPTNWRRSSKEVIQQISAKMAKNFPYRKK